MKTHKNECFAYTRVSTVKQGEGVSLEAQKEAIQAFADQNGIKITRWFEEKETAAKSGRPVFSNMMKQLRHRKAGGVIIHKIDRSARNFADWAKIGELSDSGIDVHFAAESIDFRSRGGRLTADIQAVIAADYIRNLRDESIKGINGRLKQGLWPCKAPVGYLDNGKGKVKTIDPINGPLVRNLFEAYASGEYSYRSLIDKAHELGIRNSRGGIIQKTCIEKTMTNPFYVGLMHVKCRNETYQGIHEPLISTALFDRCQYVRTGRYVKKSTFHDFTYRGVFSCGNCQRAMIGERQKGIVYYRCHTSDCPTNSVREDVIEKQIFDQLQIWELSDTAAVVARQWIDTIFQKAKLDTNKNAARLELANIEQKQERLTDALIDRLIDKPAYEKRNFQLLKQANGLQEKLTNAPNLSECRRSLEKMLELLKSLSSAYIYANSNEKRQFIKTIGSNRRISARCVYFEPRNWVSLPFEDTRVLYGTPSQETPRSGQELGSTTIEHFRDVIECEHLKAFLQISKQK